MAKHVSQSHIPIIVTLVVILAVVIIGGLVAFLTTEVPTTVSQTCYKDVPVQKTVIESIPLNYLVVSKYVADQGWGIFAPKRYSARVAIKNEDNTAGVFRVDFSIMKDNGVITESSSAYIEPMEIIYILSTYQQGSITNWSYTVVPPTTPKSVTKTVYEKQAYSCPKTVYKKLWE